MTDTPTDPAPLTADELAAFLAELDTWAYSGILLDRQEQFARLRATLTIQAREIVRLRAALQTAKAQIEYSQSNEANLRPLQHRPQATIAMLYATICQSLASAALDTTPAPDAAEGGA